MKRVKNYIDSELAKKKVARYGYWSIKDDNGISFASSDDEENNMSFADHLDKIIADNVDAEVQVKYGTNEQSSRQNAPFFIRINESIEWLEPEEDDTVNINGVAHKVDKNGNVNINFTTPKDDTTRVEAVPFDSMKQEFDLQLQGIRKEQELKDERWKMELQNRLLEQDIKFKELMLTQRESRIAEREELLAIQEAELREKQETISEDVKGYVRHIPSALGGVLKEWLKDGKKNDSGLKGADKNKKQKPKRRKVDFSIEEESEEPETLNKQLDIYQVIGEEEQEEYEDDKEPEDTEEENENELTN